MFLGVFIRQVYVTAFSESSIQCVCVSFVLVLVMLELELLVGVICGASMVLGSFVA